jgi:sulfoxide reductase heme-binding subunit YedZ
MRARQAVWIKRLKPAVFVACLLPFCYLVFRALTGQLEAEPIKDITGVTGEWGLRFLLITLSVTPIRQLTGLNGLIRLRRMIGLFAFFYASLHFLTYLVLDQFFAWKFIAEDIVERPFILLGFTAFVCLVPLAITSTNHMLRWLGGRRWQKLHRLVYVISVAGILHYLLGAKADLSGPVIYALILMVLLGYRWFRFQFSGEPYVFRHGTR